MQLQPKLKLDLPFDLKNIPDSQLVLLRAGLDVEMRKRKIAFSVGTVGEQLVIEHFRRTSGLPKLQAAPRGTKNLDALSRDGDRYSIKTVCNSKKTGTIYPDSDDRKKQLFEFVLVARLADDWSLTSIYQFTWKDFVKVRAWDKRMNAWYIPISKRKLGVARMIYQTVVSNA